MNNLHSPRNVCPYGGVSLGGGMGPGEDGFLSFNEIDFISYRILTLQYMNIYLHIKTYNIVVFESNGIDISE